METSKEDNNGKSSISTNTSKKYLQKIRDVTAPKDSFNFTLQTLTDSNTDK